MAVSDNSPKENDPDLLKPEIIACLREEYDLEITEIFRLPIGGDLSTAVFCVSAGDNRPYFCKLKSVRFDESSVALPKFFSGLGIAQIISPLTTKTGLLRAQLGKFSLVLYPFIKGVGGYEVELSDHQWADFGGALRKIHTAVIPQNLAERIPKEDFSPDWRNGCRKIFQRLDEEIFDDPITLNMIELLQSKREMTLHAVERAEHLAGLMTSHSLEFVLCHSDIHPGNLFIDDRGSLFIVDWDYPMFAPRERDLMFIGGGQGFMPYSAEQEELLFYRGYGQQDLDLTALAYYRYERGITDISVEAGRVLSDSLGDEARAGAFEILQLYFLPGCTIEMAMKTEQRLRDA